jgi:hypothetical protein
VCLKCKVKKDFTPDIDKSDGLEGRTYHVRMKQYKGGIDKGRAMNHGFYMEGNLHPNVKIATFIP